MGQERVEPAVNNFPSFDLASSMTKRCHITSLQREMGAHAAKLLVAKLHCRRAPLGAHVGPERQKHWRAFEHGHLIQGMVQEFQSLRGDWSAVISNSTPRKPLRRPAESSAVG